MSLRRVALLTSAQIVSLNEAQFVIECSISCAAAAALTTHEVL
jgi:hypothetical protein